MTCAKAGAAVNTKEAVSATTTATENLKHRTMLMARSPKGRHRTTADAANEANGQQAVRAGQ